MTHKLEDAYESVIDILKANLEFEKKYSKGLEEQVELLRKLVTLNELKTLEENKK